MAAGFEAKRGDECELPFACAIGIGIVAGLRSLTAPPQ